MSRLMHDIVCKGMEAMILLLLSMVPAVAQTVVYEGKTTVLSVNGIPGHTYQWELYTDDVTVNFALVPGNCPVTSATFTGGNTGSSVSIHWLKAGIYFYKVTARDALGCAMNLKIGMLRVIPVEVEAVITGARVTGACHSVSLAASESIGDLVKYEWSLIDEGGALTNKTGITTEFLLSSTYVGPLPADFRVGLTVTNRAGKSDRDTLTIKVDQLPVAEIYSSGKLEKDGTMIVDGSVSGGTSLNFRWFTSQGQIVGPNNQSTAKLFGAGVYSLEITDAHGCISLKNFKFPLQLSQITAMPDYARTSWAQDTTILILDNDRSSLTLIPGTVKILERPGRGVTQINANGSVTYIPKDKRPGRDQFIYEVCDEVNFCASATVIIDIYDSGIKAPEGFSPNGDGINEHLVFLGLENYLKSQLHVYTRSGQLVYQSDDYLNDWSGTTMQGTMTGNQLVPTGTYYYVLRLGGTNRTMKGFVYIGY